MMTLGTSLKPRLAGGLRPTQTRRMQANIACLSEVICRGFRSFLRSTGAGRGFLRFRQTRSSSGWSRDQACRLYGLRLRVCYKKLRLPWL